MTELDVDRYLSRIGLTERPPVNVDGLALVQLAHLGTVPFENLDVYANVPVSVGDGPVLDKIVNRNRGGWCFELNSALGLLLEALGFDVAFLGAAVLYDGPTTIVDHLALEVALDKPYLVDVGFGADSFHRPLELNASGPQDGGSAQFEFFASPQGTTLTRHDLDGFPVPQYRFKRVAHELADFEATSQRLQDDVTNIWHRQPIVNRVVGAGPDRVSLNGTRLTRTGSGEPVTEEVEQRLLAPTLAAEFGIIWGDQKGDAYR